TGETINVAVLSDGAALYLDQAASTASVQSHNWVGQRIPLHATSNGKVLLSGLSEDSIRSTLAAKLPRFTPHTVTSIPQLLTQVAEVAATGSSLVIDELEVGLTAVSAPVRNAHGDVIASISASGPSFRFTEVKARSARDLLMSAAADISARLGWREHRLDPLTRPSRRGTIMVQSSASRTQLLDRQQCKAKKPSERRLPWLTSQPRPASTL